MGFFFLLFHWIGVFACRKKQKSHSLPEMAFRCREMEKHRFEVLQEKEDLKFKDRLAARSSMGGDGINA